MNSREEMDSRYKALFNQGGIGREVLVDILLTCHWGITLDPDNHVQIAESNVGMVIAKRAGILDGINKHIFGLGAKKGSSGEVP